MKTPLTDLSTQGILSPAKCSALNSGIFRGLAHEKFALACSLFILAGFGVSTAPAAVSLTGFSYTQDFNSMGTTTTFGTTGWEGYNAGGSTALGIIAADNGSSSAGGIHNYGSSAADRALGSIGSGSATSGDPRYGVVLTNNTGLDINAVSISFNNEGWRTGSASTNPFSYKVGATNVSDSQFSGALTTLASGNLNVGEVAVGGSVQRTGTISVAVANGSTLGMRWADSDGSGGDSGMALDDFSLVVTLASINNSRSVTSFTGSNTLTVQSSAAGANVLTVNLSSGSNNFAGVLQNGTGTFGLTKSNSGTLTLTGAVANTNTGITSVTGGVLALGKTAGVNAIAGNVTVGDGTGADILRLDASNQIADTSVLSFVGSGANAGTFRLNGQSETVGGLSSTGGAGIVENGGGATSVSTLTVNATADRDFSGVIANGATGTTAFIKTGAAVQTLSGASANTYTGTTSVNGGILALSKSDGVNAIAGNITIGDGTGNDVLRLDASNQIADTSRVAFSGSGANAGILRLNGNNETVGDLVSNSDGAGIIENNHSSAAATLTVNKVSGTSTYSGLIRDGSGGVMNIAKQGTGGLILSSANSYSGTTTISAGTLIVTNNAALGTSDVVVAGQGKLEVGAGVVLNNVGRTFSLSSATATYTKAFANSESFSNANVLVSKLAGGVATEAEIAGGVASSAGLTLQASFSLATGDTISDIVTLSGLNGEAFALQLTVDPGMFGDASASLGWFDSIDNGWKLAVEGNQATGSAMLAGYENWSGDFASFQLNVIAAGTGNIADYVGAYGVDSVTGKVWAIVDHNSDFAVVSAVPEPGTAGLLAAAGAFLLAFRRRARA